MHHLREFRELVLALGLIGGCGAGASPGGGAGGGHAAVDGSTGGQAGGAQVGMGGAAGVQPGAGGAAGGTGSGLGGASSGGTSGGGGAAAGGNDGAAGGAAGVLGTGGAATGGAGGAPTLGESWYPQDLSFTSTSAKANPYSDVTDFKVIFSGPGGVTLTIPGFYVGNNVWTVRFAPTVGGPFTYVTSSAQDPTLNGLSGTAPAAAPNPNGHGALRVDPSHPHHYLYDDGTRPFQMGYELDWLGLMDFGDPNVPNAKTVIDMVAAHGFSEVLMNAYAYDTTWKAGKTSAFDFGPPAQIAWPGTNAKPDQTRMNEAYWQSYDKVIAYLFEKGLTAHVFLRVYNKGVNWPTNGSADDDLYFRYVVARYQAYDNVVWDFSKETYNEPDQTYIAGRLNLIGATDGYHRLRTLHDPDGAQSQYPNYCDVAAHAGTFEFYTDQQSTQYATAVAALKKRAIPYYNAEVTEYQVGNDGTFTYGPHSPAPNVLAASLEVASAGGYFAYYYSLQAWDVDKYAEVPDALDSYLHFVTFMKGTKWYTLTANDGLIGGGATGKHCLAAPGTEYIVYEAAAGTVSLTIAGAAAPLAGSWFNVSTGATSPLPVQGNGVHTYTNPWTGPALLHVGP